MLINLWVQSNDTGIIHQVGTDVHDSIEFLNGQPCYLNIQSMCGTASGAYSFVDPPDMDEYVNVTVEDLHTNKGLLRKDLQQALLPDNKKEEKRKKRKAAWKHAAFEVLLFLLAGSVVTMVWNTIFPTLGFSEIDFDAGLLLFYSYLIVRYFGSIMLKGNNQEEEK